jgi:hypothetical protein
VIDSQTTARLQDVVRRESLSILMYVGDAFPWTTVRGSAPLAQLTKIIAHERKAVAALGQFLARRRMPLGYIGSFPTSFTTINFLSLEYIVPRLIDFERRSSAALEADLAAISDAEARTVVEKLLAAKKRHLPLLETLLTSQPQPASA